MKNLYWVFIAIVILLGAYASIKFGLEPKAVPVVKPSNFEDPQKIGEVIHRQLFQKMDEYSIVAIGQESIPLTESVVEGLVRENEFGKPFDQIVSVGEEFKNSKIPVVVTKRETSDLLETLKKFEG
ncbi:MAG: hypothetical protein KDD25_05185, partial [Bdellovibrionales bacterium]|nr:hypothetical protein [Bdellovibrionales bacterium]